VSWNLARHESLNVDDIKAMLTDNPSRAAQAILASATQGSVEAQALLGQILLDGTGIQQDQPLAVTWFRLAANQGHAMAHNMLGRCLEKGWGCPPDLAQAATHYQLAAEKGLDWGLYNLGNLLATGRGIGQDHLKALACYRDAAQLGHAKSMNLLGRYIEEQALSQADLTEAHQWYQRSAHAGDFRGQFSYASILAEQGHVEQAIRWLKAALAGGNLNFLRVAREALLRATQPALRTLAVAYHQRAAALGDESDRTALRLIAAENPAEVIHNT